MSIEDIGSKESNEDRTWLTKQQRIGLPRGARQHPRQGQGGQAAPEAVRAGKDVLADVLAAVPADAASFSAARRFASSVRKRSTQSRTAMYGFCNSLWPSAGRSCRVVLLAS